MHCYDSNGLNTCISWVLFFLFLFWREASNSLCEGTTADANTEWTSKEAKVDSASSSSGTQIYSQKILKSQVTLCIMFPLQDNQRRGGETFWQETRTDSQNQQWTMPAGLSPQDQPFQTCTPLAVMAGNAEHHQPTAFVESMSWQWQSKQALI